MASSYTKSGDKMRITFTISEIFDWLEALEDYFFTGAPDAIEAYEMITKKLKNAEIRSKASIGKLKHIRRADDKKQRQLRDEHTNAVLNAIRQSRTKKLT